MLLFSNQKEFIELNTHENKTQPSTRGKSEEQFPKKTCRSSVGQLSVVCRPTVDRLLVVCRPTDDRLSVVCRPTVGRLSVDRFWLKYEAAVDQQSADRRPTVGDVLVICR